MVLTFFLMTVAMVVQRGLFGTSTATTTERPQSIIRQGIHGLFWTLSLAVAVHGVVVKRQHHAPLEAHGITGYIVLTLLALQWLLGGRSISLANRRVGGPTTTSANANQRQPQQSQQPQHWLVKVHVQTGKVLYGLFCLVLILALATFTTLLQSSTAGLVGLASLLALYGLHDDDPEEVVVVARQTAIC
eukprot:scaffold14698_cov196-Amphora_coffeaeformis.AAC.2